MKFEIGAFSFDLDSSKKKKRHAPSGSFSSNSVYVSRKKYLWSQIRCRCLAPVFPFSVRPGSTGSRRLHEPLHNRACNE